MKENIKNMLLTSARTAMLNGVDSLDEDMLKKELKENLQKRFKLEDTLEKVRERVLNENKPLPSAREIIEILDKEDK